MINGFVFNEKNRERTLDGAEMTGVTTVLGYAGNKENLQQWYANQGVARAFIIGAPEGFEEQYNRVVERDGKLSTDGVKELDKMFPTFRDARCEAARVSTKAAKLGTNAHKIAELFEIGMYDPLKADEEAIKRASPYFQWYAQNVEKTHFVERPLFSRSMFIAGTPDGGFLTKDGKNLINDKKFKGGIYDPSPFVQMAAYRSMLEEMAQDTTTPVRLEWKDGHVDEYKSPREYLAAIGGVVWDGSVVILVDGTGDVKPLFRYAYEQDLNTFKAALTIYREYEAYKI